MHQGVEAALLVAAPVAWGLWLRGSLTRGPHFLSAQESRQGSDVMGRSGSGCGRRLLPFHLSPYPLGPRAQVSVGAPPRPGLICSDSHQGLSV